MHMPKNCNRKNDEIILTSRDRYQLNILAKEIIDNEHYIHKHQMNK